MTIIPAPGNYLVTPLQNTSSLTVTSKTTSKILRGSVAAVGAPSVTKFGAAVEPVAQVGDEVLFLSYDSVGGYDEYKIGTTTYYLVEFLDLKGIIHEN